MKISNVNGGFVVAVLSLFMSLFSQQTFGQWSGDPTVNNAISTAAHDQISPVIVSDGADGAIIGWQDNRSGTNYDIYAQRIDAEGVVQWTSNGTMISAAANDQVRPVMASDGSGGAILAWQDSRSGVPGIYAQRINAAGAPQWDGAGVAISTAINSQWPAIVGDGAGGAIIAWQDSRRGPDSDLYAQHINAAGAVQWTSNGVAISTSTAWAGSARIVTDGAGGAIIVWVDYYGFGYLYTQRVNASGIVQWDSNGVAIRSPGMYGQGQQAIVSDDAGGAIITWSEGNQVPLNTTAIRAQRFNATGAVQWDSNGVAISKESQSEQPAIVRDGFGGAIIAWGERPNGTVPTDVLAQRISATGAIQWDSNGVAISTAPDWQQTPKMTADGAGGAIITWMDHRNGNNYDIYAQRINAAGAVQWRLDGKEISTAANDQQNPVIVGSSANGAIITWQDNRSGTSDIYASRVNGTDPVIELKGEPQKEFILHQNHPNPFNPTTEVRFVIGHVGFVSLKVFDALGREVAILVNGIKEPGTYTVPFNARRMASGVYFCRLQAGKFVDTKKLVLLR